MTVVLPMSTWTELGVRPRHGRHLPANGETAALVSGAARHFLVTSNYDALLDYNCAHSYAVMVGLLGDAIASDAPLKATTTKKKTVKAKPRAPRH